MALSPRLQTLYLILSLLALVATPWVSAQDVDDRISELESRINAHHERGENEEAADLCEQVLQLTKK